jgi:hypothetical protein
MGRGRHQSGWIAYSLRLNTAEGQTALLSLTTGSFNTAVGHVSLRSDTQGAFNTAVGARTLLANTADQNTATGAVALLNNTTGTPLFEIASVPVRPDQIASRIINADHSRV